MLVYSEEPQARQSNRLHYFSDHYQPSDLKVDFTRCESFDDIVGKLQELEDKHLHLIGSRGYVYHSGSMKEEVKQIQNMVDLNPDCKVTFWNLLTRTAGLRGTAMLAYTDYVEQVKLKATKAK